VKYTTDLLVTAVERNALIPVGNKKLQQNDIIALLNEELQITICGELSAMQEEYFVISQDIPLVDNVSEYELPSKAIGWALRDIGYISASGEYRTLPRVGIEQLDLYSGLATTGEPRALYLKDDKLECVPTISGSVTGSIRIHYERLLNELVMVSTCGTITNVVDGGTNWIITVNSVPSYTNGVDVIGNINPFGVIGSFTSATPVGTVFTLLKTSFSKTPIIGDYVAPYGKTPIPHIPEDLHPVLAQAATLRVLEIIGDSKNLQNAFVTYKRMIEKLKLRSSSRIKGAPKKLISRSYILNSMRLPSGVR
jgi:hypothetical protein